MRAFAALIVICSLLPGCVSSSPENDSYVSNGTLQIATSDQKPERQRESTSRAKAKALDVEFTPTPENAILQAAQVISVVSPTYPNSALQANKEGIVTLALIISSEGSVREVKLMSASDPIFVEPAIEAVRQWKFRPATIDGKPVAISTSVPVVFSLN